MDADAAIDAAHFEWPVIPGPRYAIIHVQYEQGETLRGEAWPIVERVPGGWQSGSHHYPDDAVLDVRPLVLVDPVRLAALEQIAREAREMLDGGRIVPLRRAVEALGAAAEPDTKSAGGA